VVQKISFENKQGTLQQIFPKPNYQKWVANGEIPIVVGTHALISKSVAFKHLAYVIIDEQHRFGVNQRAALVRGKNTEQTQNNAESSRYTFCTKYLTYRVRQALFSVKKELGGGHKELVYQKSLAEEFRRLNIPFSQEVRIPIKYKSKRLEHMCQTL